jgi:hypothetical protein
MLNATTRLVGCPGGTTGTACNPVAASAGNNVIGNPAWSGTAAGTAWAAYGTTATSATPANVDDERYLFWAHLLLANLIGGVTDGGLRTAGTAFAFGVTNPEAKIGGGFVVGYDTGVISPNSPQTVGTGLSGTILAQVSSAVTGIQTLAGTSGSMPLAPLRAAQIDRKMDDGQPSTGYVQAYGVAASCYTSATALAYDETIALKDCGLMYRIEG